jgi:hypothetical protein
VTDDNANAGIGGSLRPAVEESELNYRDIPATLKQYADGLLPWYGEDCCIRLFNRKWQFREEGAIEFINKMGEVFTKANGENSLS